MNVLITTIITIRTLQTRIVVSGPSRQRLKVPFCPGAESHVVYCDSAAARRPPPPRAWLPRLKRCFRAPLDLCYNHTAPQNKDKESPTKGTAPILIRASVEFMPPHLKKFLFVEHRAARLLSTTGVFVWGNTTTFKENFRGGGQKSVCRLRVLLAELQFGSVTLDIFPIVFV